MVEENNQNLNPAPPVPSVDQTPPVSSLFNPPAGGPKSKLPILIIGIILFLLVTVGVVGFNVFKQNTIQSSLVNGNKTNLTEYTSKEFGFSIAYPQEFKPGNCPKGFNDQNNKSIALCSKSLTSGEEPLYYSIFFGNLDNPANAPFNVLVTQNMLPDFQTKFTFKEITINSIPVFRTTSIPSVSGMDVAYFKKPDNSFITAIMIPYSKEQIRPQQDKYHNFFEQILSTFKFTNQNQTVDTSNWKIYQKTEFGLSIKYPQDLPIYEEVTPTQAGEKGFTSVHFVNPPKEPGMGPIEGVWIRMYDNSVQPNYLITQKNDYESLIKLAVGEKKQIIGTMFTRLANDTNLTKAYVFEERAVPNYPAETISYAKGYLFKNVYNLIYISVVPLSENSTDKYMNYFEKMLQTLKLTQ